MATLWQELMALAAAGVMMVTTPLDTAAPHNDVDGLLFLTNRQWRVSKMYRPELREADVPGQVRNMRPDAAAALEEMFAACKADIGVTLRSVSGFRSYEKQTQIYNNKLSSVSNSQARADEYVARPGASEHQLGLAMDVGQAGKTNLTASFGSTAGGKWMREHCWEYGFILRYQEDWEDVTGYKYEPWHVRYVGKELAAKIYADPMPLETWLILYRTDVLTDLIITQE